MKIQLFLSVTAAALLATGCDNSSSSSGSGGAAPAASGEKKAEKASDATSGNPVTAPVDYLGSIAKQKKSMEGKIDVVSFKQAIDSFSATEGRNPKDLDELVEKKYMKELPKPPYNMKFAYDAKSGDVTVVPK